MVQYYHLHKLYICRLFYWVKVFIRDTRNNYYCTCECQVSSFTRYRYTARRIAKYFGHPFEQEWFNKSATQPANVLPLWQVLPKIVKLFSINHLIRHLPRKRPVGFCGCRRWRTPARKAQPRNDFQSDRPSSPRVICEIQNRYFNTGFYVLTNA